MLCCVVLCCVVLCCAVLHCVAFCFVVLYCAVLCCVAVCCVVCVNHCNVFVDLFFHLSGYYSTFFCDICLLFQILVNTGLRFYGSSLMLH